MNNKPSNGSAFVRIVAWALVIGAPCFAAGFFGPIIFTPDANQGPLLGIFITGPLGFLLGLAIGIFRELRGSNGSPIQVLRASEIYHQRNFVLRVLAGALGIFLAFDGIDGLRRGAEHQAGGAIVVATALLWYAVVGTVPAWFRR